MGQGGETLLLPCATVQGPLPWPLPLVCAMRPCAVNRTVNSQGKACTATGAPPLTCCLHAPCAQASPAQLQLFGPMLGAQAAVLAITRCALPVALAAGLLAAACGTLAWRHRGQRVAAGAQRGKGPEEAGFQQGEGAPWEAAGQDEGAATPPLAGASPRARRGRGRAVGGGDGNGVDSWPLLAESPDES